MLAKVVETKSTSTALAVVGQSSSTVSLFDKASLAQLRSMIEQQPNNIPKEKMHIIKLFMKGAEANSNIKVNPQEINDARPRSTEGISVECVVTEVYGSQRSDDSTTVKGVIRPDYPLAKSISETSTGRVTLTPCVIPDFGACLAAIIYDNPSLSEKTVRNLKDKKMLKKDSNRTHNMVPYGVVLLAPGSLITITLYRKGTGRQPLMCGLTEVQPGHVMRFHGLTAMHMASIDRDNVFFRCAGGFEIEDQPSSDTAEVYHQLLRTCYPQSINFLEPSQVFTLARPPAGLTWRALLNVEEQHPLPPPPQPPQNSLQQQQVPMDAANSTPKLSITEVDETGAELGCDVPLVIDTCIPAITQLYSVMHLNYDGIEQVEMAANYARNGCVVIFSKPLALLKEEINWVVTRIDDQTKQEKKIAIARMDVIVTEPEQHRDTRKTIYLIIGSQNVPIMSGIVGSDTPQLARYVIANWRGSLHAQRHTMETEGILEGAGAVGKISAYVNNPPLSALPQTLERAGFELSHKTVMMYLIAQRLADKNSETSQKICDNEYKVHPLNAYRDSLAPPVVNVTHNPTYAFFDTRTLRTIAAIKTGAPGEMIDRVELLADSTPGRIGEMHPDEYAFFAITKVLNTDELREVAAAMSRADMLAMHHDIFFLSSTDLVKEKGGAAYLEAFKTYSPSVATQIFAVKRLLMKNSIQQTPQKALPSVSETPRPQVPGQKRLAGADPKKSRHGAKKQNITKRLFEDDIDVADVSGDDKTH